jgi:hypothetical protein
MRSVIKLYPINASHIGVQGGGGGGWEREIQINTQREQGGISFSTNQRFCLDFCRKPIRMRKTLHHMKFVYKHMGLLQSFAASGFFLFCHEIDICCS